MSNIVYDSNGFAVNVKTPVEDAISSLNTAKSQASSLQSAEFPGSSRCKTLASDIANIKSEVENSKTWANKAEKNFETFHNNSASAINSADVAEVKPKDFEVL